eukprot:403347991
MERQQNIYDLLGEKAIRKKGIIKERVVTDEVDIGQHLSEFPCFGVLFSAHWCPPCKGLLINLKKFHQEVNFRKYFSDDSEDEKEDEEQITGVTYKNFELVYIYMDNSKEQYKEHMIDIGNWLAIPFGDPRVGALKQKYEIVSIPQLVIFDSRTGKIIKNNARNEVFLKGHKAFNDWKKLITI